MIWYVRRITLTCNTAALVPRAVCSSLLLCSSEKICVPSRPVVKTKIHRPCRRKEQKYRPFPSWKKLYTVQSRREKKTNHPVPSWQYLLTVPSRRDNFCLPSPVPSWQFLVTVPSRHETKWSLYCIVPSRREIHTHRPVPSYPGNYIIHCFTVPSHPVFIVFFPPNMSKQSSPVPSRKLPAMIFF